MKNCYKGTDLDMDRLAQLASKRVVMDATKVHRDVVSLWVNLVTVKELAKKHRRNANRA